MNVKKIINNWDPIDLLLHAPKDEYHSEINAIEKALALYSTDIELGNYIYNVFSKSFGITFDKSVSECVEIAQNILNM